MNNIMIKKTMGMYTLSVAIIFIALIVISLQLITTKKNADNIDFSCTSEIESLIKINDRQWILSAIATLTSFHPDKISLLIKGKLTLNNEQHTVNRRLLFNYTVPDNRNKGAFISSFKGHEKKPDDDAPDNIDYIFFDAYQNFDKINIIKRIDEKVVIIGDNFSPIFACIINNID